jgi:helicase
MIALSATIGNANELAKWLDANLVVSDYRPVKLRKGIEHNGKAYFLNEKYAGEPEEEELMGTSQIPEIRVLEDTLSRKKQVLFFYSTKRNAEAGATKIAGHVERLLTGDEKVKLGLLSQSILDVLDRPTEQCEKLSMLVKRGVAFQHAGLMNGQRALIENSFKNNMIKALCSTTTLGYGLNLPAHTVLIRDISRYNNGSSEMMGVNEVLQLFGRAGRPKYDTEGRALLIAPYKERVAELYKNYILASPEDIESKLGIIPVLRTHVLSFIAESFLNDKRAIHKFLMKSFYGFQYGNEKHIGNIIDEIIKDLTGYKFIEEVDGKEYKATKIGKRVSELYIDPLSARWILNVLERDNDILGNLYMICNTMEMKPYVRATNEAEEMFAAYRFIFKDKKLYSEFERMDYGYYDPIRAFSTALLLKDWIDELREQDIVKKYRTTPGEVFSKLSNADWMIYSATELAKLSHRPLHNLIDLRVRLRYGIREELLDLVRLEQIGRVRARMLYMNGIKTVADIRNNKDKVIRLFGKEISAKILSQVG